MKTIELIISPTGETTLETHGYAGSECQAATRQLEAALGVAQDERLTSEFYAASQPISQRLQHRGGSS